MRRSRKRKNGLRLLATLIILLFLANYTFLDEQLLNLLTEREFVHVDRIIDGDTIEANSASIRLLSINTPERGEKGYQEAKDFLQSRIYNKTVSLEYGKDKKDKYGRTLAYVYLDEESDNKSINIEMVENGFANYYFYSGKDIHSNALIDAWETCINNKINLCEPSENQCSQCISLELGKVINSCNFQCNITGWQVRPEGREKFIFSNQVLQPGEVSRFALDLSNSGGNLFLRDEEGKLVDWSN